MSSVARHEGLVRILVICTANRCRSPVAAVLLRRRLASDAPAPAATVFSAGVFGGGLPVPAVGRSVLTTRGIDLSDHRSAPMTPELVSRADLVVGMERSNVREAVVLTPDVWTRAFTLRDLVRRCEMRGPRSPDQSLREYIATVGAGRQRKALVGTDANDDVTDPFDQPASVWARVIDDLDQLTARLADALLLAAPSLTLCDGGAEF